MRKIRWIGFFLFAGISLTSAAPIKGDSHVVQFGDTKVHYTSFGEGEDALLLVHGWSCDETVWEGQTSALGAKMRVITIDLPGHGESDKPAIDYTMHLYAGAMNAVLTNAKIRSVIPVGHSNGTPAIWQFYREYPATVRALVIVEGGLRPFVDAARMEKFIAPLRGNNYPETAGKLIAGMTQPIADEALRQKIATLMLRTAQHVAVSEFEGAADPSVWRPDKINVPVLMILAKQPIWTSEYEQFARSLAPDLDYQIWEHVSHFVMMEKPAEFNAAIVKFLEAKNLLPKRS